MKRDTWIAFIPFYLLLMILFIGIAKGGSKIVSTIAQTQPVKRTACIVIDAGHGGEDGGASSCTGALESHMNLSIALRLDDLLHFLGHDTRMIRRTDTSVYTSGETLSAKKISDLKERVRIANITNGAVLVSIHQNTFPDRQYDGAQVFYRPDSDSRQFAQIMQEMLKENLNPGSRRKCKKAANIYLMDHISCPGVLIECGFLSNPEEEAKLRSTEYQQRLAIVIAASLNSWLHA